MRFESFLFLFLLIIIIIICVKVSVVEVGEGITAKLNLKCTFEERPDPKGLSTFSQCTEFLPHRGIKLMSYRSGVRRYN
jgi:hypothetical protein